MVFLIHGKVFFIIRNLRTPAVSQNWRKSRLATDLVYSDFGRQIQRNEFCLVKICENLWKQGYYMTSLQIYTIQNSAQIKLALCKFAQGFRFRQTKIGLSKYSKKYKKNMRQVLLLLLMICQDQLGRWWYISGIKSSSNCQPNCEKDVVYFLLELYVQLHSPVKYWTTKSSKIEMIK